MPAIDAGRRHEIAAFYAREQRRLRTRVAHRARGADEAVIADACAFAWLALLDHADVEVGACGLAWLTVVATHEAWRLIAEQHRQRPVGAWGSAPDVDELPEPVGESADPLDRVIAAEEHADRVARFASLSNPCQRRDLLLHAAGYRYKEITRLTDSSYTTVNHNLTRGRLCLAALA
jgi:DNA-directed RNA polymerase specialized sigma24 family protein